MVSADCILCGRKFSLSGMFISDKLLCPDCATHHESECIKAIHEYYNEDVYHLQNEISTEKENVHKGYFFTNSYLAFCKLKNLRYKGETLAEFFYKELNMSEKKDFFDESYDGEFVIHMEKNILKLSAKLRKVEKDIYTSGDRVVIRRASSGVKLEEVYYRGYYYSFLVDSNKTKVVCILLNFYRPEEKHKVNKIIAWNEKEIEKNESTAPGRSSTDGYTIINTYNSFCKYVEKEKKEMNSKTNEPFYNEIMDDLEKNLFSINGNTNKEGYFQYLLYDKIIIVYGMNNKNSNTRRESSLSSKGIKKNCKKKRWQRSLMDENESDYIRQETESVLGFLQECHAFDDE